jgi:ribosome-associated heat shock protein Hsp15
MNANADSPVRPNSIRIDKWLWAARFFKTRGLASRACELGRIDSNSNPAKPSREVHIGDHLLIRNEAGEFAVEVLAISAMRGPSAVAQTLYRESEESRQRRLKLAAERKAFAALEPAPARRPTKKDRRLIHQFRSRD